MKLNMPGMLAKAREGTEKNYWTVDLPYYDAPLPVKKG